MILKLQCLHFINGRAWCISEVISCRFSNVRIIFHSFVLLNSEIACQNWAPVPLKISSGVVIPFFCWPMFTSDLMSLWLDDKPFGLRLDGVGPSVASCFDSLASLTCVPGLTLVSLDARWVFKYLWKTEMGSGVVFWRDKSLTKVLQQGSRASPSVFNLGDPDVESIELHLYTFQEHCKA